MEILIDDIDRDLLEKKWFLNRHGYYARNISCGKGRQEILHRLIFERKIGRGLFPKEIIHFVNGNKNNITRDNLTISTNRSKFHSKSHREITNIIVDPIDEDLLNAHYWIFSGGYFISMISRNNRIHIHRIIMERIIERPLEPKELVDHKNRITTDNRRENLRVVSHLQNSWNKSHKKQNKLGCRGVSFEHGKYRARITVRTKIINLGSFIAIEDAKKVYQEAEKKFFGEYRTHDHDLPNKS